MRDFILYTIKNETQGLDTQVNLRLKVVRNDSPIRLSDFLGGTAELFDGYSTTTSEYAISLTEYDNRRLKLINNTSHVLEIYPEFKPSMDPKNPLDEIPLKQGQDLSGYTITKFSWELK